MGPTKCIQCNQCSYVCPHATIRPFALTEEEAKNAPAQAKIVDIKAGKGKGVYKFAIAVSPLDCMGCSVCVSTCPVKALTMKPQESQAAEQEVFDYMVAKVAPKADVEDTNTVKGSQFKQPLLEFSGSCAGCAETAYARLITQVVRRPYVYFQRHRLFLHLGRSWPPPLPTPSTRRARVPPGPTPCSRITPSTVWACIWARRPSAAAWPTRPAPCWESNACAELKDAAQKWLDTMEDGAANAEATKNYIAALEDGLVTVDELAAFAASDAAAFASRARLSPAPSPEGRGQALLRLPRLQAGR